MLNNRSWALVGGVSLGAVIMYLLDPQTGRRRRAMLGDRAHAWRNDTAAALGKRSRNIKNHARGAVAELRGALRLEVVDDDVLAERVRAALGRAVSRSGAVDVVAADGLVVLSGHVLASELPALLAAVHRVRGVRGVESALDVHEAPEQSVMAGMATNS
jgi:hypothetical protein